MHDTVRLERKGVPTVCLSNDLFETAARRQAELMGLPGAAVVVVPHEPGGTIDLHPRRVDESLGRIVDALVGAPKAVPQRQVKA